MSKTLFLQTFTPLLLPGAFNSSIGIFHVSYWLSTRNKCSGLETINTWLFLTAPVLQAKYFHLHGFWYAMLCTPLSTWMICLAVFQKKVINHQWKLQMDACSSLVISIPVFRFIYRFTCYIRHNNPPSFQCVKCNYVLDTIAILKGCQEKLFTNITLILF